MEIIMRILVVSDTHGRYQPLLDVVDKHPEAAMVLHCGDGEADLRRLMEAYPQKRIFGVCGNNDFYSELPLSDVVTANGVRIYMTHGHTLRGGIDKLMARAREANAQIALYGHTHVAKAFYEDGLYVLNPGSLSRPRAGGKSYGIIDITNAGIMTNVVPYR